MGGLRTTPVDVTISEEEVLGVVAACGLLRLLYPVA